MDVNDVLDNILEHHGVKGMKWGVRRDRGHEGERVKNSKLPKLDAKWTKKQASTEGFLRIYNHAAGQMNSHELGRINNKPQYKNADFTHDSALRQKYDKEIHETFIKHLREGAQAQGMNPSGTQHLDIEDHGGDEWHVVLKDVQHATHVLGKVKLKKGPKGHVVGMTMIPDTMTHDDLILDEFLEHFGIKGMHWGVRKEESSGGGKAPRRGKPVSVDAARSDKIRRKVKTRGVSSLSNAELKALNERINLEQNYSNLTGKNSYGKKASREGANFAKQVLLGTGQELAKKVLVQKGTAALIKQGLLVAKGG